LASPARIASVWRLTGKIYGLKSSQLAIIFPQGGEYYFRMSFNRAIAEAENNPDIIMTGTKAPGKRSGTNARKTEAYGIVWDSAGEAARYGVLLQWQSLGVIMDLEAHPGYIIQAAFAHPVTGEKHRSVTWKGDYAYCMRDKGAGKILEIVEDFKGRMFPQWVTKRPFIIKALGTKILFVNQDLHGIYHLK
jgi:hypothetical protein